MTAADFAFIVAAALFAIDGVQTRALLPIGLALLAVGHVLT